MSSFTLRLLLCEKIFFPPHNSEKTFGKNKEVCHDVAETAIDFLVVGYNLECTDITALNFKMLRKYEF